MTSVATTPILKRWLRLAWFGPADLPRSLHLEWRIMVVRWLGIAFVAPGLPLANLNPSQMRDAYGILVFATIYNAIVAMFIMRRPSVVESGYWISACDALLNIAMLVVAGGFATPLSYLLFTVTIATAMRYGYGPALAMTGFFVLGDLFDEVLSTGKLESGFFFRSGFLFMTAVLAGYLRQQARNAESALGERLRQASLLNDSTTKLGASLDLDDVFRAVTNAAARVFDSPIVVLGGAVALLSPSDPPRFVSFPDGTSSDESAQLRSLCLQHLTSDCSMRHGTDLYGRESLANGRGAIVLELRTNTQSAPLATIALTLPTGVADPQLDRDILDSFIKRATLAVENASLYRKLTSSTADLRVAYADLEQAHRDLLRVDEMKTDFLANVSHEFRTPLTSIRSFSELLLTYGDTVETQREFVEIINHESERLTRMVNDVLDITKIESGYMDWHMAVVDIGDLVQDLARSYRPFIEPQNLTFEVRVEDDLPPIWGDRDRLHQVIGNLLANAAKFTESGAVTLRAERRSDDIVVSVTDTGIGIEPADHDRIFKKFQQVGAVLTNKPRGTGLGLSICREIVEFHRGHIWLDSRLGSGSTFGLSVPVLVEGDRAASELRQLVGPAS